MTGWMAWIKAIHIAAAITFFLGIAMAAMVLRLLSAVPPPHFPRERQLIRAARAWDRRVTTPAMLVVWSLGFCMAQYHGWFGAHWLSAKLACVVGLSALHGVQSGTLRRMQDLPPRAQPPWPAWIAIAAGSAAVFIVVLVTAKPDLW